MTNENKTRNEIEGITIPFGESECSYILPAIGPNLYWEVKEKILQKGLIVPVGEHIAPLLHSIYCNPCSKNSDKFKEVINAKPGVYVFNRNLWTPQGVYVIQDPGRNTLEEISDSGSLDPVILAYHLNNLIKGGIEFERGIKFSKDGKIRFAPKGAYNSGEVDPELIANDGFVIANFGKKGAELLGEVARNFANKPFLYTMDYLNETFYDFAPRSYLSKVASIGTEENRLNISGIRNDGGNGRGDMKTSAFGILLG
jgi:hypothetical protein